MLDQYGTVTPRPYGMPSQRIGVVVVSVLVLMFGFCAAVFYLSAFQNSERERLIASDPVRTTAVVVEVERVTALEGGGVTYVPTVEFEDDGQTFRKELQSATAQDRHDVGDEVAVTYQQGNPSTAEESSRLGEDDGAIPVAIAFTVVSAAIAVFGSVSWIVNRRRFRREGALLTDEDLFGLRGPPLPPGIR